MKAKARPETEEIFTRGEMTIIQVFKHMIKKFRDIPDEKIKGIIMDIAWDNEGIMCSSGVTQGSLETLLASRTLIDQRIAERALMRAGNETLN